MSRQVRARARPTPRHTQVVAQYLSIIGGPYPSETRYIKQISYHYSVLIVVVAARPRSTCVRSCSDGVGFGQLLHSICAEIRQRAINAHGFANLLLWGFTEVLEKMRKFEAKFDLRSQTHNRTVAKLVPAGELEFFFHCLSLIAGNKTDHCQLLETLLLKSQERRRQRNYGTVILLFGKETQNAQENSAARNSQA